MKEKKDLLWLIRWADGDLRSYYGQKEHCQEWAEEHKNEHGGSYEII